VTSRCMKYKVYEVYEATRARFTLDLG